MNLKKIVAGGMLAGTLALGTASMASADSGATTPTRPTQEQLCQRAKIAWQRLQHLDERSRAHYDRLTAMRDKALAEGNTELAAKIDARLARLHERHDRIAARLETLKEKGQDRCNPADAPSGPTTTAPEADAA